MELTDELLAIQKFMESCNIELIFDDPNGEGFIAAKCRKYGTSIANIYLAIDNGILKLKVVEIGRNIAATEPCFVCALADPSCFDKLEETLAEF
jgi:hypothetical protein